MEKIFTIHILKIFFNLGIDLIENLFLLFYSLVFLNMAKSALLG